MEKKIVLVDIYQLQVAETGIKKYIEELISLINESESSKYKYHFFPENFTRSASQSKLRSHWNYFLHKQYILPKQVKILNADILFLPDYYAPIKAQRAKKVVVFHDTFFWDNPGHYGRTWWAYFRRAIMKGIKKNAFVLTISDYSKKKLQSVLPKNTKIEVLHHAQRFRQRANETIINTLNLQEEDFFLHVGVFESRKNLPLLVKAFAQFNQMRNNKAKLVLVGKEPPSNVSNDLPVILEMIADLAIGEDVLLPGYLNDEEIAALYQNASAYVFPSLNEGFGYPILEAFVHDCPLIISDQEALTEVAGDAALQFKQKNLESLIESLSEVLDNKELQSKLRARGAERLRNFDRLNYVQKLENYFEKVLRS